ncbi:MAG: cell division protein FtsQ/DivIB [Leucobacter sp.]
MKRPGGFDRLPVPEQPEAPRPGSRQPDSERSAAGATGSAAARAASETPEAPEIPADSPVMRRLRRATDRGRVAGAATLPEERSSPEGSFFSDGSAFSGESSLSGESVAAFEEPSERSSESAAKTPDAAAPVKEKPADESAVDLSAAREGDAGRATAATVELSRRRGWGSRAVDPVRAAERRVREADRQVRARRRRETKRFSAAARRRRRNWLIALGAVLGLAVFVVAGAFTPLMAVREVQLVGAQSVNEADVQKALARFEGVPLALVESGEVHRALEPFPLIQRYSIERLPPHTLMVRIEERVPVMSIERDDRFELFDAAGVLVGASKKPPAGVPLGTGEVTDRTGSAFLAAGRALRDMPAELREQIAGVTASSPQSVTFTLASGVEVIWGDAEETRRKSLVLQTMLEALGDRKVEQIDVSSTEAPVFR